MSREEREERLGPEGYKIILTVQGMHNNDPWLERRYIELFQQEYQLAKNLHWENEVVKLIMDKMVAGHVT